MLMRRSVLFGAVAALLGVVIALMLVEVVLRVFSLAPSVGISTVTEAEFRRVPGLFGPAQHVVDRRLPALPFEVSIDSLGYRGSDFPLQKPPEELRILAVGDSYTYGDFVANGQTLPAAIERRLSSRCERPVRVINAGVGGSTISTHLPMVERGWVTSPDVVVLTFSENDVDDLRNDMWAELAAHRKAKSRFPLSVAYPILRHLALWHFALEMRSRLRVATSTLSPLAVARPDSTDADVTPLRARYARLLGELTEEIRSKGSRAVLLMFPSHWTVSGARSDEQLRWVRQLADEQSVPTVNILDAFRASGLPTNSLYLLPHDGHASPRGNEIAGEWVVERLVGLNICDASRPPR